MPVANLNELRKNRNRMGSFSFKINSLNFCNLPTFVVFVSRQERKCLSQLAEKTESTRAEVFKVAFTRVHVKVS